MRSVQDKSTYIIMHVIYVSQFVNHRDTYIVYILCCLLTDDSEPFPVYTFVTVSSQPEIDSELSSWLLSGQQIESLLALHSLLGEGIIGRESGGVSTDRGVVAGVIELSKN